MRARAHASVPSPEFRSEPATCRRDSYPLPPTGTPGERGVAAPPLLRDQLYYALCAQPSVRARNARVPVRSPFLP